MLCYQDSLSRHIVKDRLYCFPQEGVEAKRVQAFLLDRQINVSISPKTSTRLDFEKHGLPESLVRASVHYYNSGTDIDQLVQAVSEAR